jgi:hypothetical protein
MIAGHRKVTVIEVEERCQFIGRPEVRYVSIVMCIGCNELLPTAGNAKTAGFAHKLSCSFRGFA